MKRIILSQWNHYIRDHTIASFSWFPGFPNFGSLGPKHWFPWFQLLVPFDKNPHERREFHVEFKIANSFLHEPKLIFSF